MKFIGHISAVIAIGCHFYGCNNAPKNIATSKDSSTAPDTYTHVKADTLTARNLPENSFPTSAEKLSFPKPIWETHPSPPIEIQDSKTEEVAISDVKDSDAPLMEDYPVYSVVDQMPEFNRWSEFFEENFLPNTNDISIDGVINIGFIVDRFGNVGNVKILRSSGSEAIDEEVVKTIKKSSGKWTPGKIKGENVNTKMTWPIIIEFDE